MVDNQYVFAFVALPMNLVNFVIVVMVVLVQHLVIDDDYDVIDVAIVDNLVDIHMVHLHYYY